MLQFCVMPSRHFTTERLKFHYAWVLLASSMVMIALSSTVRHSFGVFIDPLVEEYGWSRGDISLAYSISFISAAAISLGLGSLTERIEDRYTLLFSIASLTLGVALTGTTSSLWQLYLYYGLIFGGLGFLIIIIIPVAITRWFNKWVGVALGLMWASMGIGGMLGPVTLRWLITNVGWQNTFFISGIIIGGGLFLSFYFFRSHPRDMNLFPYGETSPSSPVMTTKVTTAHVEVPLVDFGRIRKSPTFWYLINIHFLGCVGHSILLAHIVSIAISEGIAGLPAAGILSIIFATSTISRFGAPIMAEKLGGRLTLATAFLMQASPIPFLFLATETWQFYAIAFFFGLGFGGEMPSFPIINRHYWGSESPLSAIYSWQLAGAMFGMALGGWLGGILFDLTGTYTWSISFAFLFSASGFAPILALPRQRSGIMQRCQT